MLELRSSPSEPPQSKGSKKRQQLVNIGTEIFTQKGFTITSLDEIVSIAGIPKGSFYYYFDSKAQLGYIYELGNGGPISPATKSYP